MPRKTVLHWLVVGLAIPVLLGCDEAPFGNRYEISKDQSGRTLRLDKRTGDIAIVDGDRIIHLRDAKDADAARKTDDDALARAKAWPKVDLPQFGVDIWLQTSWQDGVLLYWVRFEPMRKKTTSDEVAATSKTFDDTKLLRRTFTLILEDAPFELATQRLTLTRVVDDAGKPIGREAKGKIQMSKDVYRRIDSWNVSWTTSPAP